MRWDTVIPAVVVAPAVADATVQGVLGAGPGFFMAGERTFAVPSMRWTLIGNVEGELWEEALVQIDIWVRSMADLITLEGALRRLLHHETDVEIGGVKLWSKYVDSRPLNGAKDGTLARSLDFRLTYLRGRYAS